MIKKLFYLSIPAILCASQFNAILEDEISWLQDETFVISASKVKENIKKASASITVINEDMIKKMGANTLFDVLRVVPGIGVSQSNIYVDKINIRGIETTFSEKVLLLLDGHSLNSDLLNGGATGTFANFPLEHIKRIEIIKGPASALYGENAFTALINIITKEAKDIDGVQVSVKYGSYATTTTNLLLGQIYEGFEISANINYRDTNGYKAYVESDAVDNSGHTSPSSKRLNADLSLKHNSGAYLRANYNTTEDGPRFGFAHALNDEDKSKRDTYFVELGYKHKFNKNYSLSSRAYYDYFETDNKWKVFPAGFPTPSHTDGMLGFVSIDNMKSGLETLLTIKKEDFTLVSGLSYELQQIKNPSQQLNFDPITNTPLSSVQDFSDPSTNYISEKDREFWAVYSELLYDIKENIRLTVGLRYDHYSDFGGVLNPRLGAAWEVNKNNNIKLMYGEAFRAPTFAELYNKNNPVLVGNADLNPEKVNTLELNLQNSSVDHLDASLTLFKSTIDDIITTANGIYVNQGKTTTQGLEVELKYALYRGSYLLANYTYQDPENEESSQSLENISKHEAYLALNYRINRYLNLYTDIKYLDKQTRSANDTRDKVDSSLISNATLFAKDLISEQLSMRFSVYNLFDEKTYDSNEPYDYPLQGRSYMAEVTYKF